jgi:hypothetical protein
VARVNSVCAQAVARHAGHPFPFANFDPEHPTVNQLPAVGDYFARYGALPATAAALHAIMPPSGDAKSWAGLLTIIDRMVANGQRQIQAARANNVPAFIHTAHAVNHLVDQLNSAGSHLGFSSKSPCQQAFG